MDTNLFTTIAEQEYGKLTSEKPSANLFSFADSLSVFSCFFDHYKEFTNEEHPPLKREQIKRITQKMPYCEPLHFINKGHPMAKACVQLLPENYTGSGLIDWYFQKQFKPHCDHRIYHFFSGDIRTVLYYELRGNGML